MKPKLPETEIIEVVMKKKMTVKQYKDTREQFIKYGWSCQGYQVGYYQNKLIKDQAS